MPRTHTLLVQTHTHDVSAPCLENRICSAVVQARTERLRRSYTPYIQRLLIVIDKHIYAFTNMTNLKCIILFYMNVNPRIFIIINSIYLFIYLFILCMGQKTSFFFCLLYGIFMLQPPAPQHGTLVDYTIHLLHVS